MNINSQLQCFYSKILDIGPTLAWRIAEHIAVNGPFETVADLSQVDGISDEAVDRLRHLVCEELSE